MDCFRNLEWKKDIFGYIRPFLTKEIALRSIEFADLNYHGELKHWIKSDNTDYTLIRDGVITKDSKRWSRQPRPLEHLVRTIREVYVTNSSKVLVLGSKVDENKYVIGISFSGTVYNSEWLNNFKVNIVNGFHQGFLEIAHRFDLLSDKIEFPNISIELGEETVLTLENILQECTSPDSRFLLWVTGHSQGGAVAGCYIVDCLSNRNVLHDNIIGVTMATPTFAHARIGRSTTNYPIYNIINEEDIVTRLGSQIRFGVDICYKPTEEFRRRFYTNYPNPLYHDDMVNARDFLEEIKNTPDAIELTHAIQKLLSEYRPAKNGDNEKRLQHKTLKRLMTWLIFNLFSTQVVASEAYKEMTGRDIDESRINYWYKRIVDLYDGNKLAGLSEFVTQAHMLNFEQFHTTGPEHCYRGIVLYAWDRTCVRCFKTDDAGYRYVEVASLWPKSEKGIVGFLGRLFSKRKKKKK